jgi:hypothetical protein
MIEIDIRGQAPTQETEFNILLDVASQEKIRRALQKGNSIEIHPAKSGIKIYEVKKKIIG